MSGMLAKVINSTVGTSDFKSLDEVFLSSKSIVASNEIYSAFPVKLQSITSLSSGTYHVLFDFTLPLDGSCNIRYKAGWSTSKSNRITLAAYKNGSLAFSNEVSGAIMSSASETNLYIEGKKGDKFIVRVLSNDSISSTISVNLYSIDATVVDAKTMNISSWI